MLANEVLPGPFVSTRARAGERQILEMQRTEESLEIARLRRRYKDFTSAALERRGKKQQRGATSGPLATVGRDV